MSVEFFLDTNILVCTFDPTVPAKQNKARDLVERALEHQQGVISYQVVQELLNVATRNSRTRLPRNRRSVTSIRYSSHCAPYSPAPAFIVKPLTSRSAGATGFTIR